jgi:hypothetical protein
VDRRATWRRKNSNLNLNIERSRMGISIPSTVSVEIQN